MCVHVYVRLFKRTDFVPVDSTAVHIIPGFVVANIQPVGYNRPIKGSHSPHWKALISMKSTVYYTAVKICATLRAFLDL